jgi:hypothetical protein
MGIRQLFRDHPYKDTEGAPNTLVRESTRWTGLQMGQLEAENIVFLADGSKSNWGVQRTNFPEDSMF